MSASAASKIRAGNARLLQVWLKIRLRQAGRALQEVGPLYVLIFGAFALFYLWVILKRIALSEMDSSTATAVLGILLLSTQFRRRDGAFLRHHFGPKAVLMRWAEYSLVALPLWIAVGWSLLQGLSASAITFLLLSAMPLLAAVLPSGITGSSSAMHRLRGIIRMDFIIHRFHPAFEWQSGWRQTGGWFLFFNLLAISLGWQQPGVAPVCVFVMAAFAAGFYLHAEDIWMLQLGVAKDRPSRFLVSKFSTAFRLFLLTTLPATLAGLIYFPQFWWIFPIVWTAAFLLILVAVVMKYARYHPGLSLEQNSVFLAMTAASCLIPFLLPAVVIILVRYWPTACRRIESYCTSAFNSYHRS